MAEYPRNPFGAVLTGGRSRRFGSDKASARFGDVSLLDRAFATLRKAGIRSLAYVGGAPRATAPTDAVHLPDRVDIDAGPLCGILTVLDHCWKNDDATEPHDCVVVLACDLPLLTSASLSRLVAESAKHEAVVASAERDHWSCLVLRPESRSLILAAYGDGARSVGAAANRLRLGRVPVDDGELVNVNDRTTLEQAIAAVRRIHR